MGTTQFNNSELGETLAEKNVSFESTVDQTASKQENVGDGNGSEPEIYLLISHRGRKHDPHGRRRIGLFGPFGPRGPKDFSFSHGGPHRIGHPHERPQRSDVHRGPPHAREPKHEPLFMHNPGNEAFTDEHDYSAHRGMRRFGPGPYGRRGPGSEFHHEPRHHGDSSRRHHGFGPREHGHGPRGGPRGRFETEERIHSPYHPSCEHGHGPRGGPRGRFETEERARSPHHHLPREHGHGHHSREQGFGPRGRFEAEENVKQFHRGKPENHECNPQSHRRGHGPRSRLHDPRERFETEESVKEFHGKHGRYGLPFLRTHERGQHRHRNEHKPQSGSPSREHGHGPHGRFEKESGHFSDHRGPGFGLRGGRRFEHGRHRSEPDYESDYSNRSFGRHRGSRIFEHDRSEPESEYDSDHSHKSFEHQRGGRRFDHGRHGQYSSEIFRNYRGGKRVLSRNGPRLHRHARGARHNTFRSHHFLHHSHHPHHHKPLTPEELAEKVTLLNSMGFTSENNSHYEELLRKFNGRIGRVVDILLREQKKEKGDKRKEEDSEEDKDNEEEKHCENKEDYDIVEESNE